MPDLYIIVGPNGAGKSTYSSQLVDPGLAVFDGDKELAALERKLSDIDPGQLQTFVQETLFEERKMEAMKAGKDFAYETNFASLDAINTPQQFRKAGYNLKMIFIGLPDEEMALTRVGYRVKAGGHNVATDQVMSNYQDGLKNLEKYIKYFDKATIYDSIPFEELLPPKVIYRLEKGVILEQDKHIPKWARHLPVEAPAQNIKNELKPGKKLK